MAELTKCTSIGCAEAAYIDYSLCGHHAQEFSESRLSRCTKCQKFDQMVPAPNIMTKNAGLCTKCRQEVQEADLDSTATGPQLKYIYVLTLDGGDYYLGQTENLERQIEEHYHGQFPSTAGRNPQLVWSEEWSGLSAKLQERMDKLARLYNENPRAMLYSLQARLPKGGIQWG